MVWLRRILGMFSLFFLIIFFLSFHLPPFCHFWGLWLTEMDTKQCRSTKGA